MSEYITTEQKNALLSTAVIRGDFLLASGKSSHEKFDFDRIEEGSELMSVAVNGLAACVYATIDLQDHDSIAIVTVASGANRLGDPLADVLPMYHIPSRKDSDGNFYIPERTQNTVGILVDDVYTTGSSFEKVKDQFLGRIIGAYALLDRSGRVNPTLSNGVKVHSVMQYVL